MSEYVETEDIKDVASINIPKTAYLIGNLVA